MSSRSRIETEFTRQAETLAAAPAFTDADILARILAAVAPTPRMAISDVGCGPGLLVAARVLHPPVVPRDGGATAVSTIPDDAPAPAWQTPCGR